MEYNSLLPQQLREGNAHPTGYLGKGATPGTGAGLVRPARATGVWPESFPVNSAKLTNV